MSATVETQSVSKVDEALDLICDEKTLEHIRVTCPEKFARLVSLLGLVQSRCDYWRPYPAVRVQDN